MWRMSYMYVENEDGSWSNAVTGEEVFSASQAEKLGMPSSISTSKEEKEEDED